MPRGDKSSYTDKQKRQAEHIEEGYEHRGVGHAEAERRAWATVNKESGGGKKSGAGRGQAVDKSPARKGTSRASSAAATFVLPTNTSLRTRTCGPSESINTTSTVPLG